MIGEEQQTFMNEGENTSTSQVPEVKTSSEPVTEPVPDQTFTESYVADNIIPHYEPMETPPPVETAVPQGDLYPVKDKKVLVLGLGRSGVSLTKYLIEQGAMVTVTDEKTKTELKTQLDDLEGFAVNFQLGRHVLKTFQEQDLIITSPGVPLDIKPVQVALKEKVPVIGELEFAASRIKKPIIAVAGTNGKTSITAMISEMLTNSGIKNWVGGNTGTPLINYVSDKPDAEVLVVEVSSFQSETSHAFTPETVVFANVTPDHLDRHETFENYMQAKARVLQNLNIKNRVIHNGRCSSLNDILGSYLRPEVPTYSFTHGRSETEQALANPMFRGALLRRGAIRLKFENVWEEYSTNDAKVLGAHNKENFAASALTARLYGATQEAVQKTINEFKGLEHRLEFVARKNAVNFYNDSKSTNCDSLIRALKVFRENVILIAGGQNKNMEFEPILPHITGRIKNIILFGEAKEAMNRAIGDESETFLMGTFEEAVLLAYQKSRSGDTVLLSPGCSSYDLFDSYEERGNYFKQLINQF